MVHVPRKPRMLTSFLHLLLQFCAINREIYGILAFTPFTFVRFAGNSATSPSSCNLIRPTSYVDVRQRFVSSSRLPVAAGDKNFVEAESTFSINCDSDGLMTKDKLQKLDFISELLVRSDKNRSKRDITKAKDDS